MIEVLLFTALAAVFGSLLLSDLRRQHVALAHVSLGRMETPLRYWSLLAFEGAAMLALAMFAVALTAPAPAQTREREFQIIIEAPQP